jgi:hypothetical protein
MIGFFKIIDLQPTSNNSNPPLFCCNVGVGASVVLDVIQPFWKTTHCPVLLYMYQHHIQRFGS